VVTERGEEAERWAWRVLEKGKDLQRRGAKGSKPPKRMGESAGERERGRESCESREKRGKRDRAHRIR